jgi:hypothetical protein
LLSVQVVIALILQILDPVGFFFEPQPFHMDISDMPLSVPASQAPALLQILDDVELTLFQLQREAAVVRDASQRNRDAAAHIRSTAAVWVQLQTVAASHDAAVTVHYPAAPCRDRPSSDTLQQMEHAALSWMASTRDAVEGRLSAVEGQLGRLSVVVGDAAAQQQQAAAAATASIAALRAHRPAPLLQCDDAGCVVWHDEAAVALLAAEWDASANIEAAAVNHVQLVATTVAQQQRRGALLQRRDAPIRELHARLAAAMEAGSH